LSAVMQTAHCVRMHCANDALEALGFLAHMSNRLFAEDCCIAQSCVPELNMACTRALREVSKAACVAEMDAAAFSAVLRSMLLLDNHIGTMQAADVADCGMKLCEGLVRKASGFSGLEKVALWDDIEQFRGLLVRTLPQVMTASFLAQIARV